MYTSISIDVILYDAISLFWIFHVFAMPSFLFLRFNLPFILSSHLIFLSFITNFWKLSCANIVQLLLLLLFYICLGSVTIPFNQNKWKRNWVAASESNWVNKVMHIQIPVALLLLLLLFGCIQSRNIEV